MDFSIKVLRAELRAAAAPENSAPMAAYMKNRFPFFGLKAPARREVSKAIFRHARNWSPDVLMDVADQCYAQAERECHYIGAELIAKNAKRFGPAHLTRVRGFITRHSWWDTVDMIASPGVGSMVLAHPELAKEMDSWIADENVWIARVAIIHQLRFKELTDEKRLFRYALKRGGDTEFFLQKAIGWSLRQYAKVSPDAVRSFVQQNESELSRLSRREAMKHL